MTLDEIRERDKEARLCDWGLVPSRSLYAMYDRAKLIEWLDRAMTFVIDKTQSSSYRGADARALLREIKGEKP